VQPSRRECRRRRRRRRRRRGDAKSQWCEAAAFRPFVIRPLVDIAWCYRDHARRSDTFYFRATN